MRPIYDLRISQIEKILVKFCPKFLDLYESIYGTYLGKLNCLWWFDFKLKKIFATAPAASKFNAQYVTS